MAQGSKLLPKNDPFKYGLIENWLAVELSHYNDPVSTIAYELVFTKFFGKEAVS